MNRTEEQKILEEELPGPASLEIQSEGVDKAEMLAGLGYLGNAPVKRITVTGNSASAVTVNDQLTVPAGTRRAVLTFNMVTMGFGHGTIVEGPFARFGFQVSPTTLSGSILTFSVWSYFRNRNNNLWEAKIDVSAMCFG